MKKVLALVLAAMMVLAIAPMSFAAATDIKEIGYSVNTAGNQAISYRDGASDGTTDAILQSRDTSPSIRMYLSVKQEDGTVRGMTKADAKSLDIDVKARYSEGSKVIRDISIQYEKISGVEYAYIRIRFVDKFVSTGSQDYKFTVYLTQKKARITASEQTFEGTFKNPENQLVYEDYDYMYLYDAPVIEAKEYVKLTELDLGTGVSLFAKLFEGKKYYGYATQKIKSEDDSVITKYPAIGSIYYLDTIGLNSTGNYVKLDISDKLYVYNADLEYIGTTNDKLPYSTKYYVADAELDVASAGDDDVEPADAGEPTAPATNPDMGGDDVPENVNDNPGTGC